jgi:hypothetical protein
MHEVFGSGSLNDRISFEIHLGLFLEKSELAPHPLNEGLIHKSSTIHFPYFHP